MSSSEILHIKKLEKTYPGGQRVLVGLELIIHQGDIYGLLGPNGAGKTTTVNIISGLLKADSGMVEMFGKLYGENQRWIKSHFGIVPQQIALLPELTAYENLWVFGSMLGMDASSLKVRIEGLLDQFGLATFKRKRVSAFSGGMKRMVNLMVGILHKPDFLILDEPTVGIDVQSKVLILDSLKKMNAEGMTILYTSHDMEEAQRLCTRVGIIDGGKLVAEDCPEGLMSACPGCNDLESVYLSLTGKSLRNMED